MTFCSRCGKQLSEEANFCSNCGTKTTKGKKENIKYPNDDFHEAFNQAGIEIEKAFHVAAQEMHKAFKEVKEEFQSQNQQESPKVLNCKNCGTANPPDAVFCRNCGNKMAT